jgi:predicted nucleic acid-binding protein
VIILDTSVLSALMRDEPDPAVVTWLDAQPTKSVWTTAITIFEARTGLELLDPSRRRQRLESAFTQLLAQDLDGRVLAFDSAAADASGIVVAKSQRAGRTIEIRDAQIAGIALARKATLATGNVRHFKDLGVRLVDPRAPAVRHTR